MFFDAVLSIAVFRVCFSPIRHIAPESGPGSVQPSHSGWNTKRNAAVPKLVPRWTAGKSGVSAQSVLSSASSHLVQILLPTEIGHGRPIGKEGLREFAGLGPPHT